MRNKIYSLLSNFSPFFNSFYDGRLKVLAYHTVPDKETFLKQVQYLKANYNLIGIDDLLAHSKGELMLPNRSLLITFDDGDITVLKNGLPVLKKYNVKSCLFVITDLINSDKDVWIKRVEHKEIQEGKTYQEARAVVNHLKKMPNNQRVDKMKLYPHIKKIQLTSADLKYMQDSGMFIGNHTHTHPMLDKCSKTEIENELEKAKSFFEKYNLPGFNVFAYPNGNENSNSTEVLKKFKMRLIFLFDHKVNVKKMDPYHISRIRVDSDTEIKEFKAKVSGLHPYLFNLR